MTGGELVIPETGGWVPERVLTLCSFLVYAFEMFLIHLKERNL